MGKLCVKNNIWRRTEIHTNSEVNTLSHSRKAHRLRCFEEFLREKYAEKEIHWKRAVFKAVSTFQTCLSPEGDLITLS